MGETNRGGHVGSIDVFKFALALAIAVLHAGQLFYGGDGYPLPMAGIAVEGFFVISGCLMCGSAARDASRSSGRTLGEGTVRFIGRKLKALLIPYLVLVVIYLSCWMFVSGMDILAEFGKKALLLKLLTFVPNLLLLSMAGIMQDKGLMGITWYVSAMLIAMAVIYPLLRKLGKNYTCLVAPISALLLMGYMYNNGEVYKGTVNFLACMPQGLMRAFISINLGCVAWEIAAWLQGLDLTRFSRGLLAVVAAGLCGLAWFVMEFGDDIHCFTLVLFMPVLVGILFSRQMAGSALFDNKMCAYLGRFSTYLYFYHVAVRKIIETAELAVSFGQGLAAMLVGSFLLFVATDAVECVARRLAREHRFSLKALFVNS